MRLDDYSQGFADRLFEKYPQWEPLVKYVKYDKGQYSYLELELLPENHESKLHIYTKDNEVEVGYGLYHNHFSYYPDEDSYELALKLIEDLLEKRTEVIEEVIRIDGKQYKRFRLKESN